MTDTSLSVIPAQQRNGQSDAQVVTAWLRTKTCMNTQTAYWHEIKRFTTVVCKSLNQVTVDDLLDFREFLADEGLTARSRNRALAAIKSLLTFAVNTQYLRLNVGTAVPHEPDDREPRRFALTEIQVDELIRLEPDTRWRTVLEFLYFTGCRVSELVALRWRDCFFDGEGGKAMVHGKGGKQRIVPLLSELWAHMQQQQGLFADRDDLVFGMSRHQVYRLVRHAGERIGIAHLGPHKLRHTTATHLLAAGARIDQVQHLLGHASRSTTEGYIDQLPGERVTDLLSRGVNHAEE